jgi:hypothetical protein
MHTRSLRLTPIAEADAAFRWLDRASKKNRDSLGITKVDPLLQKLRGDSRFNALLRKVKLVE